VVADSGSVIFLPFSQWIKHTSVLMRILLFGLNALLKVKSVQPSLKGFQLTIKLTLLTHTTWILGLHNSTGCACQSTKSHRSCLPISFALQYLDSVFRHYPIGSAARKLSLSLGQLRLLCNLRLSTVLRITKNY
jgi:hypothetical protein